jgi:hypothetical protein
MGVASKMALRSWPQCIERSKAFERFGGNVAKQRSLCAILSAPFVSQFLFTLQNMKNQQFDAFLHS